LIRVHGEFIIVGVILLNSDDSVDVANWGVLFWELFVFWRKVPGGSVDWTSFLFHFCKNLIISIFFSCYSAYNGRLSWHLIFHYKFLTHQRVHIDALYIFVHMPMQAWYRKQVLLPVIYLFGGKPVNSCWPHSKNNVLILFGCILFEKSKLTLISLQMKMDAFAVYPMMKRCAGNHKDLYFLIFS
jgi:hypothetical protein